MAYRHYETEGFILGGKNSGEANSFLRIFSSHFGLVDVLAQGVRREKSKLRYQLSKGTLVKLTLIRGREYWRLVGAEPIGELANPTQTSFSQKIGSVLIRLIHGEEASHPIFADLKQAWELLASSPSRPRFVGDLEVFVLIRVLSNLGYLAKTPETETILSAVNFTCREVEGMADNRSKLIGLINLSLAASGL